MRQKSPVEAEERFKLTTILAPEWASGWLNLALARLATREGDEKRAERMLAKALELRERVPD